MKRPSFQFYPADWRNNAKLRRCSEPARGAWMDVLCILHDSDEYGVCRWPLVDLARASGVNIKLLKELADKDVLKGGDKGCTPYIYTPRSGGKDGAPVTLITAIEGNPCWYSSRFVRDEYIRNHRGQSSQFSTENQPPKRQPKGGLGERESNGSSSSSSSSSTNSKPIKNKNTALIAPDDVFHEIQDRQIVTDWLAIRKAKGAPTTKTALEGVAREARKAGMKIEEAIRMCCERNWSGFKASWLENDGKAPGGMTYHEKLTDTAEQIFGRKHGTGNQIIDITPKQATGSDPENIPAVYAGLRA